ncbi:zinc-dependent alcohol dehydrogenase family protein [Sphingomonas floccifaciens]|uniref:Zinc-dependent alcohol dehydrogenase family protein n=1 Tax=Sphingomonas floccifaciens TaxID=1844115 RepID=A0ABW4NDZ5_9SPHN
MQITAAVLRHREAAMPYADSRPLRIETLDLQPPGRGEVLVRIAAAGLCHSDLSVINGQRPRPLPMALGHEAAGVVEALGAGVDDLSVGDHVIMVFVPSCGHCVPCAGGRPALCEPGAAANGAGTLLAGDVRLAGADGAPVHHHLGCSAFASHAVVSRRSLVKIDRDLPLHEAALFGCAVLTGVGAVVNTAEVKAGQTVAVVGLGGVGLAAVLGALAAGAAQVIAVDLDADKLALAATLGATATVQAGEDAVAQVRALTGGGCDVVLEMAGAVRALEAAVAMTARGGTTVTAGLPPPDAALPVNIVSLVAEERTLKGSYIGTCVPTRDIPRFIALYRAGRLPVDRLVSGYLTLDEINAGFDALHAGRAVRQIVRFDA